MPAAETGGWLTTMATFAWRRARGDARSRTGRTSEAFRRYAAHVAADRRPGPGDRSSSSPEAHDSATPPRR